MLLLASVSLHDFQRALSSYLSAQDVQVTHVNAKSQEINLTEASGMDNKAQT